MRIQLRTLKYFLLASSAFSVLSSHHAFGATAYEEMRVAREAVNVQLALGVIDFELASLADKNTIIQAIARGTNLPVNTVIEAYYEIVLIQNDPLIINAMKARIAGLNNSQPPANPIINQEENRDAQRVHLEQEQARQEQVIREQARQRESQEAMMAELLNRTRDIRERLDLVNNTLVSVVSMSQEVARKLVEQIHANPEKTMNDMRDAYNRADEPSKALLQKEVESAKSDSNVANMSKEQQEILHHKTLMVLTSEEEKALDNKIADKTIDKLSVGLNINQVVDANIATRLDNVGFSAEGIASGDDDRKWLKGVWISGLYGASKQDKIKNNSGYRGAVSGATIGADFEINENTIVGLAYSHVFSNFKYKHDRIGDKLDSRSHVVSLYGQKELNDKFLLQGVFSYSDSKIKGKDQKTKDVVAKNKFKSNAFSVETNLGYKISLDDGLIIMPNIGLRYGHYKDGGYKQKGAGVHNLSIGSKSDSSVTGIFGTKLILSKRISDDTQIMPSINGSIENYFGSNKKKVKVKHTWSDNYLENNASTGKQAKIGYNLGTSLLAKHKNIEILLGYNCHLRKKYQSHQGSLKLKLLF